MAYDYIVETGVIVPDTADIQSEIQTEFKNAFGQDLIVSPETPQGVLITGEVLSRDGVIRNNATLANQINPNIAGGVYLDAIWSLTGGQRFVATRSTVNVLLTGVANTIIPAGVRASTSDGDLFESIGTYVIQPNGQVNAEFRSVLFGPIAALANTLTTIVDAILGWETINNPTAATLGRETQSDQSARQLRKNTLALQGQSVAEAITSGLYDVDGVRSLSFRENIQNITQVIDGVTLVPHSIYVCVDGGTDIDVATKILEKKSAGSNYNGTTTIAVIEPFSGQSFNVKFSRPAQVSILTRVTIKANTSILDPQAAVKDAILAFANGQIDGEVGLAVGAPVSPFELGGAINRIYPSILVLKVEVSYASTVSYTTDILPISISEIASITNGSINVIIL